MKLDKELLNFACRRNHPGGGGGGSSEAGRIIGNIALSYGDVELVDIDDIGRIP